MSSKPVVIKLDCDSKETQTNHGISKLCEIFKVYLENMFTEKYRDNRNIGPFKYPFRLSIFQINSEICWTLQTETRGEAFSDSMGPHQKSTYTFMTNDLISQWTMDEETERAGAAAAGAQRAGACSSNSFFEFSFMRRSYLFAISLYNRPPTPLSLSFSLWAR
jgi:hypothetical protein